MRTFKRSTADISTSDIKNYSKYFNQMNFKGILEDDNIYAIDQESFRDAKNIFVDWNNRLVSRPTLQRDNLPSEINVYQYDVVDVKYIGQNTIYINKSKTGSNYYFILLVDKDGNKYSLQNISKYHISSIEHYIICWNDQGAKVFDTNNGSAGWQNFNEFVEVPITKIITGSTVEELPKNEFTNQYKERYTYSNQSFPLLPSGTAEVEVFTGSTETLTYDIPSANEYTDYKIFKALKAPSGLKYYSLSSYNPINDQYILAVPTDKFVYISQNGGITYTNILYPTYNGSFVGANLTDDGLYYCFIAEDGVYFLNLGDYTWYKDPLEADYRQIVSSCFKTREIYSYLALMSDNSVRLYFKGPSLYSGTDVTQDNKLSYIDQVNIEYGGTGRKLVGINTLISFNYNIMQNNRIKMFLTKNNLDEDIVIISIAVTNEFNKDYLISVIGGKNMYNAAYSTPQSNEGMLTWAETIGGYSNFNILDGNIATPKGDDWVYGFTYNLIIDEPDSNNYHHWRTASMTVKIVTILQNDGPDYRPLISLKYSISNLPDIPLDSYIPNETSGHYYVSPQKLEQGLIYIARNGRVYFLPNGESDWLQFTAMYSILGQLVQFTVNHDKYFIRAADKRTDDSFDTVLITNLFDDNDLATLTYTYGQSSNYTKVPNVSYSDTELYLAFGDLLQITRNSRASDDVTKIDFNLPELNNQAFIDDITAMINISTTEVALFFLNKIVICSKVQDTNLAQGYRYDYYNTKLSTGVRLGDSVINTLEGQYTIFPTKRGLAIMNYQAFMATTDQVIEYISDDVKTRWDNFYNASQAIKIIQWRNRLIFTNESNIILLYDLDRHAWWLWEVPVNIKAAVTDQIDLRVIDTNLNIFKDAVQYYDFGEIGDFRPINWFVMSQPLHMSAPNYYKNLKQLVFQFSDNDTDDNINKTLNAQIKLYRKRISIKEPETIQFQIENLRTFVKRFNYWKINEIQWALANDTETNVPKKFELNGISIKYELGDEVR